MHGSDGLTPAIGVQQVHAHQVLQGKTEQVGHLLLGCRVAHSIEWLLQQAQQAVSHPFVLRKSCLQVHIISCHCLAMQHICMPGAACFNCVVHNASHLK